MKTVGKQLQEAREAKNWTPELAARATKIKVERLRDLEADDYNNFSSPAYARGFVRTYARALGLDEYKILRQLDNKLPEDDNASFVTDSGLPYIPEASKPLRGGGNRGSNTGLYVVMTLGFGVFFIIALVLFEAYRAGELPRYFAHNSDATTTMTNGTPVAATDQPAKALPVNPNAPPLKPNDAAATPKALPVDNAPPVATATNPDAPEKAVKALKVDPAELTGGTPPPADGNTTNTAPPIVGTTDTTNAPQALAVDPSELTGATNVPPVAPPAPPSRMISNASARASNSGHAMIAVASPALPPVAPIAQSIPTPAPAATSPSSGKRLILTATRDSFVRVTAVEAPDLEQVRYASVLRAGQSISFDDRKFSINVGVPAAVNISLDGVNYGPHSDQEAPETFTVESHQP